MMLYDTIRNEGAMQKVAWSHIDNAIVASAPGALIGALTNDGNRAAGSLGGGIGGSVMAYLAALLGKQQSFPLTTAAQAAGMLAGGYGGGKLGAKLDSATGNHLTKLTNKLLGRD